MVAERLYLTVFKMVTIHQLGFLKIHLYLTF